MPRACFMRMYPGTNASFPTEISRFFGTCKGIRILVATFSCASKNKGPKIAVLLPSLPGFTQPFFHPRPKCEPTHQIISKKEVRVHCELGNSADLRVVSTLGVVALEFSWWEGSEVGNRFLILDFFKRWNLSLYWMVILECHTPLFLWLDSHVGSPWYHFCGVQTGT